MKMRFYWKKTTLIVFILLMFTNTFLMAGIVKGQVKTAAYWPTNEWNVTNPSDQDMNNATMYEIYDFIEAYNVNLHSVSIVRNGFLVHEEYISNYKLREEKSYGSEPDYYGIDVVINGSLHAQFSATKTIIALLIGIAIDKGFIDNVNQTFAFFFPTLTYNNLSKKNITIEHLLTMTSGIYGDTDPEFGGDKTIQQILNPDLKSIPGSLFRYSSYSINLLSAIINKSTGQKTSDFAQEYLFDPIGISEEDSYWLENSERINTGGYGLYFTPQAMARIGLLMLNNGMWNDTQVISENWMLKVGTPQPEPQPNEDYGYLVWMDKYSYHAAGLLGQLIFLIPAYNLTVVFTADSSASIYTYIYMIDNFIIASIGNFPPSNPVILGYSLVVFLPLMILSVRLIYIKIKKKYNLL